MPVQLQLCRLLSGFRGKSLEQVDDMYYTIHLSFEGRVSERILASGNDDRYSIDISAETGRKNCFITFEKNGGSLRVLSDKNILVTGDDEIRDGKCSEVEIKSTVISGALFVSELNDQTACFERFFPENRIVIGSDRNCDIVLKGDYISRRHAEINCHEGVFTLNDFSENGTFVNGRRINGSRQLDPFDIIWIFGVKIVFTGESIAVQKNIRFAGCSLERSESCYETETGRSAVFVTPEPVQESIFSEKDCHIVLRPEKSAERKRDKGISDIMKTAVPAAAVLTAAAALKENLSVPGIALLFAGATGAVSGVWLGGAALSDRLSGKRNALQSEDFLKNCVTMIKENKERYRKALSEHFPGAGKAAVLYGEGRARIKSKSDPDFLKFVVSYGKADVSHLVSLEDGCSAEIKQCAEKYSTAADMPVIVNLKSDRLFHAKGDRDTVISFIRGMAVKISALCDPDDVKMMFMLSGNDFDDLSFVKWLPHVCSVDGNVRYCSCDSRSSLCMTDILTGILKDETADGNCMIVFTSDEDVFSRTAVKKYIASEAETKIIFIVYSFTDGEGFSFTGQKTGTDYGCGETDTISPESAMSYARSRAAAGCQQSDTAPVPESLGFLEMFEKAGENAEDLPENYRRGKASEGLKALIGFGENNRPFYLDLHENGHGPHGLVAGTTGSGKSELIQTFILSLALSYSPEQAAFVLIDYKGGGMSGVFEDLPHTAGVLTNLSDSRNETGRILLSLSSEIKRRQKILKESSVNHIDAYMRLFERGMVKEPMPHLVLICDEFAELKKEQPGFINELVSISRVGRSLGIHLILATQRPAGVVDDEIKSNSGFRICLKVQDRDDSLSLTGRPDAAYITQAGRGFIQYGSTAELVQTGYSGTEYSIKGKEYEAVMIRCDGTPVFETRKKKSAGSVSELEMLTAKIREYCTENGVSGARKLWSEPLPSLIRPSEIPSYGSVRLEKGLVFAAGVSDDPENQSTYPSEFDLYETGNIIAAGSAGSGKTMFLAVTASELAYHYPPEKVKFKGADMTGGLLSVFGNLPHSEGFVTSPDEREMRSFLDSISEETERRRKKFFSVHAADFSEYRETDDDLPLLVVFIDGFGILRESFPSLDEQLTRLSGESAKYGIVFIITVKQASDIRIRTRQNFRTVITYSLNDRTEYTEFLGARPECSLPSVPGRGLMVSDGRILQFQTAVCCFGKGREKYAGLLKLCEEINEKYKAEGNRETDSFCVITGIKNHEEYTETANELSGKGRVLYWNSGKESCGAAEVFTGPDGAFDLLCTLRGIFSERNTARKISGFYEGEKVSVLIEDPCGFFKMLRENKNDDMAVITETFLTGGSGFGVSFVTGKDIFDASGDRLADIFIRNSGGGAAC